MPCKYTCINYLQAAFLLPYSGHRIPIDTATYVEMYALFKSTISIGVNVTETAQKYSYNAAVENFLRSESPDFKPPRTFSPPIFSRDAMPGGGSGTANRATTALRELAATLPFADDSDSESDDRYKEDMRVINGWRKLTLVSRIALR